jgi:predicted transcriptional regulator
MKLEKILKERGISKNQIAMQARISPADFYQAINGNKPFFPAWRARVAEVLDIPEEELFKEDEEGV